jgi:soluble lytic murein transglycosylase
MKLLFFVTLLISFANSTSIIKKSWLEKQPRSYAKDFYISLYLKQNITSENAIWALGEAKKVNNKLLYSYAKALHNIDTSKTIKCMKLPTKKLYNKDANCIKLGLRLYQATRLSKNKLRMIIKKLEPKYPKIANSLKIIDAKVPFLKLINSTDELFFDTFNKIGSSFRNKYFNHHIPLKKLKSLVKNKNKFKTTIKLIVTNPKLNKLQKSLLYVDASSLKHKSQFFLAINAIKQSKLKIANNYLDLSLKTAYYKFDKDKVMYWQYQIKKDEKILKELSNSLSNNIYSIFAKEKLNIKITNIVKNSYKKLDINTSYDYNNPFSWLKVLKDIKKLDKRKKKKYEILFNTKKTQGHLSFINERFYEYKKTYLPNPYKELMKNYPIKRQILINALAKQESRFIPTSISTAYALGVMQIMPFLSKELAKELNEPYDIFKQLEAKTNIKYANKHLNFLEHKLNHILFIAYAYNGGIGFTKNMILKTGLFKKKKYEPYLSMELIPYDETKKYGKKVLVNYLLYNNKMNPKKKFTLKQLILSIKN